jgi:RHS repeat-associated protein
LDTVKYLVDTNNWISHVVAETDGSGALKAFYTRGGDILIHMNRAGTKSYYLFDGHGSVRMLANEANFVTDTWNFDAWGEITFHTGVTENDYLYAGERFDRTTELYQLRARYMDPKTGTFMTMDTYQGNMHDPVSLHKYMYANANPITNVDPTGMTSLADMGTSLYIRNILDGTIGLNYAYILQMLMNAAYAVQLTSSITNLITAALTGDLEGVFLAIGNGTVSIAGLMGICQYSTAMQILVKSLAAYSAIESWDAFLKAVQEDDVDGMLVYGVSFMVELYILFDACFDGDTPVAAEGGFKRIDEMQVGDRVWSYNVETGEKSLKEVKQVFVKESDEMLHIETTEGDIDATTNHPFYVTGKGWVAAGDLVVGDKVHTLNDNTGTVTGSKFEKLDKPIPVYNIDVEDFHSYFVANGVLVHNEYYRKGKPPLPEGYTSTSQMSATTKVQKGSYVGKEFIDWLKSKEISTEGWEYIMQDFEYNDFITGEIEKFANHYWVNKTLNLFFHHVR